MLKTYRQGKIGFEHKIHKTNIAHIFTRAANSCINIVTYNLKNMKMYVHIPITVYSAINYHANEDDIALYSKILDCPIIDDEKYKIVYNMKCKHSVYLIVNQLPYVGKVFTKCNISPYNLIDTVTIGTEYFLHLYQTKLSEVDFGMQTATLSYRFPIKLYKWKHTDVSI